MTAAGNQAWMAEAACARLPDLPWTLDDPDQAPEVLVDLMHEVCAGCPVRDACAAYAEEHRVSVGCWAGQDRNPDAIWRSVVWVPVHGRGGRFLGEQAALPLGDVA